MAFLFNHPFSVQYLLIFHWYYQYLILVFALPHAFLTIAVNARIILGVKNWMAAARNRDLNCIPDRPPPTFPVMQNTNFSAYSFFNQVFYIIKFNYGSPLCNLHINASRFERISVKRHFFYHSSHLPMTDLSK